jgi:hypothetical protein
MNNRRCARPPSSAARVAVRGGGLLPDTSWLKRGASWRQRHVFSLVDGSGQSARSPVKDPAHRLEAHSKQEQPAHY